VKIQDSNSWQVWGESAGMANIEIPSDSTAHDQPANDCVTGAPDSEIARKRRDEILCAAEAIIASEGLPRLSLSRIEHRAGMSRGQLTYYFPTKEAILLAVFDRMLARMIIEKLADAERSSGVRPGAGSAWEGFCHSLQTAVSHSHIQRNQNLYALMHTFLAQVGHRDDFRTKLAAANQNWRRFLVQEIGRSLSQAPFAPELLASIIMALLRGLTDQLIVDPQAFDREKMLQACQWLFRRVFSPDSVSHEDSSMCGVNHE
jgi:AcrR family transcriptional regulator